MLLFPKQKSLTSSQLNPLWHQVSSTHTAVHACGVCQPQPVDALVGADEDDDVVEVLQHLDSSGQHSAVEELDFDGIVKQVGVQRLFHQLHRVPRRGPVQHRVQRVCKRTSCRRGGHVDAKQNSPVDESVASDRQQLPAVLIVVGSGTVWKLHTAGKRPQTCGRQIGNVFTMCWLTVT